MGLFPSALSCIHESESWIKMVVFDGFDHTHEVEVESMQNVLKHNLPSIDNLIVSSNHTLFNGVFIV